MKLINPEVRIENTNACNSKCTICPREKMTRPITTMGNKHFFNLVDQAKDLGAQYIGIYGYGEPLIDSSIGDKINYCTLKKLKTHITTNACFLTYEVIRILFLAKLTSIRFSVHGITKEGYENVHKGLNWDRTMVHITDFILFNGIEHHYVDTEVTVIPMNGERTSDIIDFWENKVDNLEIWRPHNWINGREYRKVVNRRKTCGRPERGPVQINSDGKMMVCCFDYYGKMAVGDTYKDSIGTILKNDRFNEIRDKHERNDHSGLICKECDQLNFPFAIHAERPLIYSSRDKDCLPDKTSITKIDLRGQDWV